MKKAKMMKYISESSWIKCPFKIMVYDDSGACSVLDGGILWDAINSDGIHVYTFGTTETEFRYEQGRKDFMKACRTLTKNNIYWETI